MPDGPNVTVMPFTLTDVIRSLRELMGFADDVSARVKVVSEFFKHHKGKRAAGSLDVLSFRADGSLKHLENIVTGKATNEDFDAILGKMNETGAAVERSMDDLKQHRDFIRNRYGMALANKIDFLVYGSGGKESIRADLRSLVSNGSPDGSSENVTEDARRILANITDLNKRIEEFHDQLLKLEK